MDRKTLLPIQAAEEAEAQVSGADRTLKLADLLKLARPLPWPVNGKVAVEGLLTAEQLVATRIYRRHAANVLPGLVEALNHMKLCRPCAEGDWEDCAEGKKANIALAAAEAVKLDD